MFFNYPTKIIVVQLPSCPKIRSRIAKNHQLGPLSAFRESQESGLAKKMVSTKIRKAFSFCLIRPDPNSEAGFTGVRSKSWAKRFFPILSCKNCKFKLELQGE